MSRCFPFPPPGYVRKAGAESANSVDLLKQDKHREKKDKKEKNREKRDSKERKEKDRNDEKHRDKKEKKDKHGDKKDKKKEKKREKDHSSSSNDKKLPLQTGINEEKTSKEKGPLPSLLPVGQAGDRSIRKEKERDKDRNSNTPDGKRLAGQNVEKTTVTNNNSSRNIGDNNKNVQELEKHVRNDKCNEAQLAEKFMVVEKKKDDGMVQFSTKPTAGVRSEGREWNKERRDNEQRVERVNGTLKVQNFGGAVQTRVQEVKTPLGQKVEREMEWREKLKGREGEDKQVNKWKEKDGEKTGQGKVKELVKEREEDRMREKSELNKHSDQERLKLSRKNDFLNSLHHPVKEPDKTIAAFASNIKKRKEPEANGALHANEIQAKKMAKQTLASHHPLENGRILESYPTPPAKAPPWSGPANNSNNVIKANKEDRKINGVAETWPPPPISSSVNMQSSTSQANSLLVKAPLVKPPHPDSKYLDEILDRVPRTEELPELDDDQGWLFDANSEYSMKSERNSTVVGEMPQVWGESLHIGSADIYALPYVVPY